MLSNQHTLKVGCDIEDTLWVEIGRKGLWFTEWSGEIGRHFDRNPTRRGRIRDGFAISSPDRTRADSDASEKYAIHFPYGEKRPFTSAKDDAINADSVFESAAIIERSTLFVFESRTVRNRNRPSLDESVTYPVPGDSSNSSASLERSARLR